MKKNKRVSIYAVVVSVIAVLAVAGCMALLIREGYGDVALEKLGLKEPTAKKSNAVEGWINTLNKMDYDADVVFFGDSITRGSDFRAYFPAQTIVNLGYGGDTLPGMLNRVAMVKAVTPEKVFVLGGVNGLTNRNGNQCVKVYAKLLDSLKEAVPNAEIYVQSVLPISVEKERSVCKNTTIEALNEKIKALAAEKGLTYIDLHSAYVKDGAMNPDLTRDGVHLKPEAYALWADLIREYMA